MALVIMSIPKVVFYLGAVTANHIPITTIVTIIISIIICFSPESLLISFR